MTDKKQDLTNSFNGATPSPAELQAFINLMPRKGDLAGMEAFLDKYPDAVNAQLTLTNTGVERKHWSALMIASANGQKEIVKMLLRRGADEGLGDAGGRTAVQYANREGQREVAAILEQARALKAALAPAIKNRGPHAK